jgi:hypothetical protein
MAKKSGLTSSKALMAKLPKTILFVETAFIFVAQENFICILSW